jgi:hypothetical protein
MLKGYLNNKMSAVDVQVWAILATHSLCHHLYLLTSLCNNES